MTGLKHKLVGFALLCALVCVNAAPFHLQVTSAANYTWEDTATWAEGTVPQAGDDVYLNVSTTPLQGAQLYVNINSDVTLNSLSAFLQIQLYLTLNGASTLQITSEFTLGCILEGPGTFIIAEGAAGTFTDQIQWVGVNVKNYGSATFMSQTTGAVVQDTTIENFGTWSWSTASATQVIIKDLDVHLTESVYGMIVNSGTMNWMGEPTGVATEWFMFQNINNTGTFNLQQSVVYMGSNAIGRQMPIVVHQNGLLAMDASSQWWVHMGTYYCDSNHTISGDGVVYVLDESQNSKGIGSQFIVNAPSCNITNLYLEGWSELKGATPQSVLYVDTFTYGLADANVEVTMVVKVFIGQPPIHILANPPPPCNFNANMTITQSGNYNGHTGQNVMYLGPNANIIVNPNVELALYNGGFGSYTQPAATNPFYGNGTIYNYGTVLATEMEIVGQFFNYGTLICNATDGVALQLFGGGANYGTIISQEPYESYEVPNDSLCAFGGFNGRPFTFMPGSIISGDGYVDLTGNWHECTDYSSANCMATSTIFTSDISFKNAHSHPTNAIAIPDGVQIYFGNLFCEGGFVTKATGAKGTGTLVIGNGFSSTLTEPFGDLTIDSVNVYINGSFQAYEQAFKVQNNGNLTITSTGILTLQSMINTPVSNKPGYLINNGQLIFAAGEGQTPIVTVTTFNNGVINTTTGSISITNPYYSSSTGKIILNVYSATKYDTWNYNFPQGPTFTSCPIGGNIVFAFQYTPAAGDTYSFITYNGGSPTCSGKFSVTTTGLPSTMTLNVRYDQSCFGMCAKAEVCSSTDSTCINQGPSFAGPNPTPAPTVGPTGGSTTNGTSTDGAANGIQIPLFAIIVVVSALLAF